MKSEKQRLLSCPEGVLNSLPEGSIGSFSQQVSCLVEIGQSMTCHACSNNRMGVAWPLPVVSYLAEQTVLPVEQVGLAPECLMDPVCIDTSTRRSCVQRAVLD